MKKLAITSLIVLVSIIFLCFQASSNVVNPTVDGAVSLSYKLIPAQTNLINTMDGVIQKPLVEYSDAAWGYGLTPIHINLTTTTDIVLPKPLIEHSDATVAFELIEYEGDLTSTSGETLSRPLVEYADTVITKALIFPEALFNPVPPQNLSPICSISGSPLDGLVPLNVTFTMTASDPDGYVTNWTLDIDNDGVPDYNGSGNLPSTGYHTYTKIGAYTAILTVTDNQSNTASDTIVITVIQSSLENQPPIANYTYSTDGYTVAFTDTSTDSDGEITSWYWDFGDQMYSTKSSPIHEYEDEGSYTVKLTVSDDDGETNTFIHIISVEKDGESFLSQNMLMLILIVGIIIVIAAVIVYWVLKKRKET